MVPINYLAVLVSAVVMFCLGGVWYGPLFGKQWIAAMGFDAQKVADMQAKGMQAMWKSYALMFTGSVVLSFVLSHAIVFAASYLQTSGISAGLQAGFWNWLGFIAPVTMGAVLWDGKPWKLWFITSGYYLVALLIAGTILALWT